PAKPPRNSCAACRSCAPGGTHERRTPHRHGHARPGKPVAGPVLLLRSDARLFPRPRRGNRRTYAPRTTQTAERTVWPIGPGQDFVAARRAGATLARSRLLPGIRAHRLRPRITSPFRTDQAGSFSRHRGRRPLDAPRRLDRRRVAVGVPAPPRRPVARRGRTDTDPTADLRPVRRDLHAGPGRRCRPPARETIPGGPRRPGREPCTGSAGSTTRKRR